ncbi:MAG: MarR family transcriptional regulator [Polyangiaceae bacterium]|nr:MarR family transcriptional regulator [Polyangiaceae bacterium]
MLNLALTTADTTPSSLAKAMNLSLPSVSQMIERLVKQGLARRVEHSGDRRKRTIEPTAKAKTFLTRFRAVRIDEFETATASLSSATRRKLTDALTVTLDELERAKATPSSRRSP